jgi:MOSC domain-containing protein YiiM
MSDPARSTPLDSSSAGAPDAFQPLAVLEAAVRALTPPSDRGRVAFILRRGPGGVREALDRAELTPDGGLSGDAWARGRRPDPLQQLAVIQWDVARLVANGQPVELFGDNLFLDLDLSRANLPPRTRLRAGGALLEVTSEPHDGCAKFRARFGPEALRFVSKADLRHANLRGVYMRVIEPGPLAVGDELVVLSRGDDPAGNVPLPPWSGSAA